MTAVWVTVAAVGVATAVLKATGPVLLGGGALPERLGATVALLAPALLAALVVTAALSEGARLVVDERLLGVGAAVVAVVLRAPILVVIVVAALVTAVARAV